MTLASFLAGSILTLVLPVGLLIVIAIWYVISVTRLSEQDAASGAAPSPPPSSAPDAAPPESSAGSA
jgi:hypothetical protein